MFSSLRVRRSLAFLLAYLVLLQSAGATALASSATLDAVSMTASADWVRAGTLAVASKSHDVLKTPSAVAVAANGAVYVADSGHHQIRVVHADGRVGVVAGTGNPGDDDGAALSVRLKNPGGVAIDRARNLVYIADSGNHKIKVLAADGTVATLAGSGHPGLRDGSGTDADFHQPSGLALGADGSLYVADTLNHAIRRITPSGAVSTLAGTGTPGFANGSVSQALFQRPSAVAVAANGDVYVADTLNHIIRRIAGGVVTTMAGSQRGFSDGSGASAKFAQPSGIAIDDAGALLIADTGNHRIRRIALDSGAVSTIAGTSKAGLSDGAPASAQFNAPLGIGLAGALYIADSGNDAVRVLYAAVSVTSVEPASGPSSGGNEVRLFGEGFVPGATEIRFGNALATSVTVVSGNEVVAIAPGGAGRVDVSVTTPAGTATLPQAYSFGAVLEVHSIEPRKASTAGGINVTVTGSNFVAGATRLFIGSREATNVVVTSPSMLTARIPSGFAGLTFVRVMTAEGQATKNAAFTYYGVPQITSFTPLSGFTGTLVTVNGSGFDTDAGATQVRFGSVVAVPNSVTSNVISVPLPPGVTTSRISVTTIGGTATSTASFEKKLPLASVQVLPAQTLLGIGEKQQFIAIGTDIEGNTSNVTSAVSWTSSNGAVATVAADGRVTVTGAGSSTVRATIQNLNASGTVTAAAVEPPPADPVTVAPSIDRTVPTTLGDATRFLFEGPAPIQRGVTPNVITEERISVMRGRVQTAAGQPIEGVRVSALGQGDYGYTRTRADGGFDFAANGGNVITLVFEKSGYPSVQRQFRIEWEDFREQLPVVMTPFDGAANPVTFNAATTVQVARGNAVTDSDGQRRATMLFAPGTQATMVLPNGTTTPVTNATVRATEYTVGAGGPAAMPGELPMASGYTYAVELSLDEAVAAKATEVRFTKPVYVYLENFLNLRSGIDVPAGYYDRVRGAWIPSDDGRVIKVLAINGGLAEVDGNGDNVADDVAALTALGFTDDERRQLATLYTAGQTLWRVPVKHFTPWDFNFPYGPPPGADAPSTSDPESDTSLDEPTCTGGSVIECENQTLGESVPVAGTGMSLHYRSDRVAGRKHGSLKIRLSGATLPPNVKRIDVEIDVLGRRSLRSFPAQPNLVFDYEWDGRDGYGRLVAGQQTVNVNLGYTYDAVYQQPAQLAQSFGAISGIPLTGSRARSELTLWKKWSGTIGYRESREFGIGGWTLTDHHAYDRSGGMLFLGNGERRSAHDIGKVIGTITGQAGTGYSGNGGPAAEAKTRFFMSMVVAPDGTVYIGENGNDGIRKIDRNGIITQFAGGSAAGFRGPGHPAIDTYVFAMGMAISPDGLLHVSTAGEIYRINRQGIFELVAGNNNLTVGNTGDGGPAVQASIAYPRQMLFAPDGTLYFSTYGSIRYVTPGGIIHTLVGAGKDDYTLRGFSGDGGPASQANVHTPYGMAWGPDGALYFSDRYNHRIRRIGQDGIISTVAGSGCVYSQQFCTPPSNNGDGGQATNATLSFPHSIAFDRSGALYITDPSQVRKVTPDGIISTIAGSKTAGYSGDGGPATAATMNGLLDLTFDSKGALYISDSNRLRRVGSPLPGFSAGESLIASSDGSELFLFDDSGRHIRTLDAMTNAVRRTFDYTGGRLSSTTDASGNVTMVQWSGNTVTIIAPGGQRTTLALNAEGYVASITNPMNETTTLGYGNGGLLTSLLDARGASHAYHYDGAGRLILDQNPAGGSKTLVRNGTADVFDVTVTTALGRAMRHFFERLPNGSERRILIDAAGLSTTTFTNVDQSETITYANGTRATITQTPDPRFGLSARTASTTLTTPGGRAFTRAEKREATLSDPYNPLSLTSLTTTLTTNGRATVTIYDAASRTMTRTFPSLRTQVTQLDAHGRPVRSQHGTLAPMDYVYDVQGRLSTATTGGRMTTFGWNERHELASITDSLQRTTRFVRDAAGRVTRMQLPDSREIGYTYDAAGNITSVTPPGRAAHSFAFSGIDQNTSYTPAGDAASATTFVYDKDGGLSTVTRPGGDTITMGRDAAGRLKSVTTRDVAYQYTYDGGGRVSAIGGAAANVGLSYDGFLLTGTTWSGAVAGSVSSAYDNDFRVSSQSVNGSPIAFGYDPDDLLVTAGALTLTRDAANGLLTGTALGKVTDEYTYDQFGEVASYTMRYDGTPLLAFTYTRDALGRIESKTETSATTMTESYTYDAAGRLTVVSRGGSPAVTYDYDANSNRTGVTRDGVTIASTHDGFDRMLTSGDATYTYTPAGELATKSTPLGTTTYTHDGMGTLRKVVTPSATIEYVLDAAGRRVGRKVGGTLVQGWLYDASSRVVAELDGTGAVVSRFVYASREHAPDYMIRGGVTYRIVGDHLGSPRMVVDTATGNIAQYLQYDEFGRVTGDSNPGFQPFGFAGGLYDRDTQLTRFGMRDYDASAGRWITRDPILFEAGQANLYGYVSNDPMNFVDPTGLKDRWYAPGSVENDSKVPLTVVDMDNGKVTVVGPGKETPGGVDWDFVRLPDGTWHKIGVGELDIGKNGKPKWGQFNHRKATPQEVKDINNVINQNNNSSTSPSGGSCPI